MTNVANLKPRYFAAFLSGAKRTEWRWRRRPDPRLEAVERGEPILFLECGSDRSLHSTVRAVMRFSYPDGYLYAIRLCAPKLGKETKVRKIQGWTRRGE